MNGRFEMDPAERFFYPVAPRRKDRRAADGWTGLMPGVLAALPFEARARRGANEGGAFRSKVCLGW